MKPLSVYIHIPFCVKKCAYCDFASFPNRETCWTSYIETLLEEIHSYDGLLRSREIISIFIGGGTPSLIPVEYIASILQAIPHSDNAEISMESNPGTFSWEKLKIWKMAGVNRLSIGAQSFDDAELKMLGRIHSAEQIEQAVCMARETGFENINLDLMYALPGQRMATWERTLRRALALRVEHLSAYSLIIEEGTPIAQYVNDLPDEDTVIDMQRLATRLFAENGYERYEISNYAKPGKICRHNKVYWQGGDYLGLGCAAHSLVNDGRFENPRDLDEYLRGVRHKNPVNLSEEEKVEERVMLATRTCEGVELCYVNNLNAARRLEKIGLIEISQDRLALTEKGMELHNSVVLELLGGM